ncbi:IPT/TIG domain-containing protein [Flavihumibacter solisilvae]|uniref:IPT/TIG domain-containing protein n=1 Tax=Flavihumibacter solisilvae TaxID=1349421 RepID=UPI000A48DEAC|nr:IPT/TIG domain-containing protein [Flavihumibacter solisilvae]
MNIRKFSACLLAAVLLFASCGKKNDKPGDHGNPGNPPPGANAPTIGAFLPASGAVGTIVRIAGTNFNTDRAKNIVKFNGTEALVSEATTTELRVTVPAGATSGKITLTIADKTATSSANFTVTGDQLLITGVTPDRAETGNITIEGTGFINTGAGIFVKIGNLDADLQPGSTTTRLIVNMPAHLPAGDHDVTVIANSQSVTRIKGFHRVGWMVKKIAGSGATGRTDGPGTTATFTSPAGLTIDKDNNFYVIDGPVIRKIAPDGTVTSPFTALSATPAAITIDRNNNIYASLESRHVIVKIDAQGVISNIAGLFGLSGDIDGIGENARLNNPKGIAVDPGGQFLYVSDWGNHKIKKIDLTTRQVSGYTGDGDILFPGNLALHDNGTLYVCQSNNGRIRTINTQTAEISTFVQGLTDPPNHAVIDESGAVYVLTTGVGQVAKYDANGQLLIARMAGSQVINDSDGAATEVSFGFPSGFVGYKNGQGQLVFYIADTRNRKIKELKYE